jgi:hypothetical protein
LSHSIDIVKSALAASCLALAACGSNGSADLSSPAEADAGGVSIKEAAAPSASSPNGTSIPSATRIIDNSGNTWTVVRGVVFKNGAPAGATSEVKLLLYDNDVLYQENVADDWWVWSGKAWSRTSNPRNAASPNGAAVPAATQITDSSGNIWAVVRGVVYKNGAPAGATSGVTLLLYDDHDLYQENVAGDWWIWNGSRWVRNSDPRINASTNGTAIPSATQITDYSGNVWALGGGVVYVNGAPAGATSGVTLLLYDNDKLYQENSAGNWWIWSGGRWVRNSDPRKTASPSGTAVPLQTQITDSAGNVWTVDGGVAYRNGALAGYSKDVTLLLYDARNLYQENSAGNWYLWNGKTWLLNKVPPGCISLSWNGPTQNTNGTRLADLAGYTIYYGTSHNTLTRSVQVEDPTATGYVLSNLGAGTYYFAVAAYTWKGTESARTPVVSITMP